MIGWVTEDQLDPDINKVLAQMPAKTMSQPLRASDGYHIYYVHQNRKITEASIPPRDKIHQSLFGRRAERASANKLQNLRNSAYIDNRMTDK